MSKHRVLTLGLLFLLLAPIALVAQAHPTLRQFEPNDDYVAEFSGVIDKGAQIRMSRLAAALLIESDKLPSPILIWAGTKAVEHIAASDIVRNGSNVDLVVSPTRRHVGDMVQAERHLEVPFDGGRLMLKPKPALVGVTSLDALFEHSPHYRTAAADYSPNASVMAKLAAHPQNVKVRVYYGTWCHVCKSYLPNLVRVAQELAGSAISFEYYGLEYPPEGWQDPQVRGDNVTGLPTAVVLVGGKEVGRFGGGADFSTPESKLHAAID